MIVAAEEGPGSAVLLCLLTTTVAPTMPPSAAALRGAFAAFAAFAAFGSLFCRAAPVIRSGAPISPGRRA